jgi:hypothetical protein
MIMLAQMSIQRYHGPPHEDPTEDENLAKMLISAMSL